ncbi:hypothetical protein EUTSA_v10021367mg [Eutrema salsugineum]|uniref:DOMON domain-containing protein n=1 Tax=Eutrema salsugineum TaxID=72664 RepID=V4LFM1_EUTSA|nr:auxin-induced in root cultures protein 12 [Eutrema salsugineum]ESQ49295.1 hypothetical protein EUTSA_v10021367mg [Eutrema salsugineum]
MASHNAILLLILAVACFSPAIAQSTCSTQNVRSAERTPFESCLDLPVLDSYLHYTYNASNSSLSVAFVGTPSQPNGGWVAWAINPTATGMGGSQAFVAFRSGAGAPVSVRTYNISSYSSLVEGRLSFEFWDLRAVSMSGGRIAIHTSVKVPAGADSVNQVWQIGGNVTNGRLGVHPFAPANLNSRAVLRLTGSDAPASAPGSSPGSAPGPSSTTGGSTTPGEAGGPGNAGSMTTSVNFGVNLAILVLLGSVFIFWI